MKVAKSKTVLQILSSRGLADDKHFRRFWSHFRDAFVRALDLLAEAAAAVPQC